MQLTEGDKVKIRGKMSEGKFICYREVYVSENSPVKKTVAVVEVNGERIECEKFEIRQI